MSYNSRLEIRKLTTEHKNWRNVLIGFNSYLLGFNRPNLTRPDPDISIPDCIRERKIVYFSLPVNSYPLQARTIAQSVQSTLRSVSSLMQTGKLPMDTLVSVYIDEFGSLCDPSFVEVLNKARSSGMMVTLGCQTMHDLAAVSENFMRRVDENTANKIILRQSDPLMCESISKSIGTAMKAQKTYREKTGTFGNQILTGEASVRHVEEFILHPNQIKNLPAYGQGYFIGRVSKRLKCVNLGSLQLKVDAGFSPVPKPDKKEGLELFRKYCAEVKQHQQTNKEIEEDDPWSEEC